MTFRVVRFNEATEVETVIQTGINTKENARDVVRTEVRQFLNDKYNGARFELRWMPRRGIARYRKLNSRQVITWTHEEE